MFSVLKIVITLLLVAYPILMYFGLQYVDVRYMGIGLLLVIAARFFINKKKNASSQTNSPLILGAVSLLIISGIIFNKLEFITFYPAVLSVLMLGTFLISIKRPPNVIEQIAVALGETPSEELTRYTRKVCLAWCVFFAFNGTIALITATLTSFETWTLYNGFISYCLMGSLFAIEFIFRPKIKLNTDSK